MKIGRNEPCLCGSGKKYKRCCHAFDDHQAQQTNVQKPEHSHSNEFGGHGVHGHGYVNLKDADELDEASNMVPALIRAGKLDDAEVVGLYLLERFPGQIDGFERLADVYEARGDVEKAIDCYRKAAVFATLTPGFEPETARTYAEAAKRLELSIKR